MTFADFSQNRLCPLPIHYIVIRYPQQMVQMAFCDLSQTYHKKVTNVSPVCFCHPTVGNLYVSLTKYEKLYCIFIYPIIHTKQTSNSITLPYFAMPVVQQILAPPRSRRNSCVKLRMSRPTLTIEGGVYLTLRERFGPGTKVLVCGVLTLKFNTTTVPFSKINMWF